MEQYSIHESGITIEGRTYSSGYCARMMHPDGRLYGTFRTYTLLVDGDRVTFRNCVFENTSGPQAEAGQALALYLDGDEIRLEDCVLKGHQDTLFLAPLPEKEIIPGGFLGPKEHAPRKHHTMYFRNCLIEGGIDFIFGGATAYFDNCEFRSVEPGYVFAPSTPEGVKEGFVVRNSRFTRTENVPDGSVYIARPWRNFAKVRLEDCWLGAHIARGGFHDWDKAEARATVEFTELRSVGPGACPEGRPDYVKVVTGDCPEGRPDHVKVTAAGGGEVKA